MQIRQKFNASLLSRIGAIFLLLIFLGTPMIESLHHHGKSGFEAGIDKKSGQKSFSSFEKKCKVCELIKHQFPHFYIPGQAFSILILLPDQKLMWHFLLQSSSSFILKCANKGPPFLS
ncbi:hypothetical protein AY601_1623 [Pedobacter cryoconitis]|uniref:DUF2946 domain-containing protein n=1 Tax=Pedobacter cryoconitis TaxID=188932 RepID=A0A127VC11_9SPHI|nr:hypothetical protein [Pedobacter cryoconitis]AMP98538.1 hypothetical protein AY601_1623 [Pedobacter cryoconitis]